MHWPSLKTPQVIFGKTVLYKYKDAELNGIICQHWFDTSINHITHSIRNTLSRVQGGSCEIQPQAHIVTAHIVYKTTVHIHYTTQYRNCFNLKQVFTFRDKYCVNSIRKPHCYKDGNGIQGLYMLSFWKGKGTKAFSPWKRHPMRTSLISTVEHFMGQGNHQGAWRQSPPWSIRSASCENILSDVCWQN